MNNASKESEAIGPTVPSQKSEGLAVSATTPAKRGPTPTAGTLRLAELRKGSPDKTGEIIDEFYFLTANHAIYRSGNRILVQYADERSIAEDQITKTRELVALGLDLQILLQDLRNPARYYWEISCALHLALLGQNDDATKAMRAAEKKIRELRARRGRAQYLLSAAATTVAFTIPSFIWLLFKHQSLEGAFNWNFLLLAIAAGAIGAQFSMALSIPRLEQFDNEWTANNVEGVLRILVGSIAAAVLWLMLDSGLIQVAGLKVTAWQDSLVIGFLGGFSERLVPHLLVTPMRVSPPDLDRRSAGQVGDLDRAVARLEHRIGALQINPVLDNFDGIVSVHIGPSEGEYFGVKDYELPVGDGGRVRMKGVRVAPQQDCRLSVQFEPIRNRHAADEPVTTEYGQRIEIKTGNAVKVVSFDVTIDCRNIIFSPSVQMSTFTAKVGSSPLIFGFSAPQLVGKYDAFVEVSQKNRLIQVIPISIFVMDGSQ